LIFYGENEAEYGNPLTDNAKALRDNSYFTFRNLDDMFLGGVSIKEIREKYNVPLADLMAFLPASLDDVEKNKIEVHYLGYYLKWVPQEIYYYAVEHCGFKARPFRSQGTYSKYSSIDDKIDDLHYYTTMIKFGVGRASYDAAQEIRNKHISREEGVALVSRFDGEFPDRYFGEMMEYLEIGQDEFHQLCDKYRSPHLWGKNKEGQWKLRHNVGKSGLDD